MDIGNAIKTCRIRRGYSQTKLAELAECSVSYLSLIEHNQRDITLSTLQKICHALHVPIGILLFLGTSHDEFGEMSKELEAELAKSTLVLLSAPANEQNNWSNVFVQSPDIISPQRIPILTKTFLVNPLPVPHNKKCQIWWSGILQSVSAKSYQLPFAFCITAPITPKAISAKQNITPAVSMSLSVRR